jgi:hypothetical protein
MAAWLQASSFSIPFNHCFMKPSLLLAGLLLSTTICAQDDNKHLPAKELRGSGRVVELSQNLAPFEAVEITQFPAQITINAGGSASAADILIDDNLQSFLEVKVKDKTLSLAFKDPQNTPFWVSKAILQVVVSTPALKKLVHTSNSDITVNGLKGDVFSLDNQANGDVNLRGSVSRLEIMSRANGTISAEELTVETANVVAEANANIRVNAQKLQVTRSGFATISNERE